MTRMMANAVRMTMQSNKKPSGCSLIHTCKSLVSMSSLINIPLRKLLNFSMSRTKYVTMGLIVSMEKSDGTFGAGGVDCSGSAAPTWRWGSR